MLYNIFVEQLTSFNGKTAFFCFGMKKTAPTGGRSAPSMRKFGGEWNQGATGRREPAEWAESWGAYWLWSVAMPEEKVPALLTQSSYSSM